MYYKVTNPYRRSCIVRGNLEIKYSTEHFVSSPFHDAGYDCLIFRDYPSAVRFVEGGTLIADIWECDAEDVHEADSPRKTLVGLEYWESISHGLEVLMASYVGSVGWQNEWPDGTLMAGRVRLIRRVARKPYGFGGVECITR